MATAIGIYDLYWDGKRINTEYFAPGFTDYDHHLQYGIYPLENIQPGTYELRQTSPLAGQWDGLPIYRIPIRADLF